MNKLKRGFSHYRIDGHRFDAYRIDGYRILSDCTWEAMERLHQTHVFKLKYGCKDGGGFSEDLFEIDCKDLYSYC